MNSLQIALCDDNSLSRQLAQLAIQEYERQHPDRPCRVHAFSSGTALLSFLDVHKDFSFDLFILDMMMPTLDGIQIGKELRARGNRGHIVYLSASPDFAIPAYEVHAYSYLLKPIDRSKLFAILDQTQLCPRKPEDTVYPIYIGPSVRMVSLDELVTAELDGRTIRYTLEDGSVLQTPTIRNSFKTEIASLLTHDQFVQCSVSAVVNLRYASRMEKNNLYLLDGRQISISRQTGSGVKEKWQAFWSRSSETGKDE